MPDKTRYTIIKYLTFISPIVILMAIGLILFHTLMLAVTFTVIVGTLGLIGLAFYVRRKYSKEVKKTYEKYRFKI